MRDHYLLPPFLAVYRQGFADYGSGEASGFASQFKRVYGFSCAAEWSIWIKWQHRW